jgi:hypothetical protein
MMTNAIGNLATSNLLAMHPGVSAALWSLAILVGLFVLAHVALWYRRRIKEASDMPDSAFTLAELETMREQGQLDEEEFKHLRNVAMAKTLAELDASDTPASRGQTALAETPETPEEKPDSELN